MIEVIQDMIVQGTPEWFEARCGRATASRFKDILAKTKTGPSTSRKNYAAQLVCERLTGKVEPSYTNAAMQWGTDQEPFARMALEQQGIVVDEVGFLRHDVLEAGASPDGLIDSDGMVEIKCPNTATHIETLMGGMPSGHMAQIQGQLWIAQREWCWFVSYDPRMPEKMQLFTERVMRDDKYIGDLQSEVSLFLAEVNTTVARLKEKYDGVV